MNYPTENGFPVFKCTPIEVILKTGAQGPTNFTVQNYLQGPNLNVQIWGIEVFTNKDLETSPISNATQVADIDILRKCILTLNCYDPVQQVTARQTGQGVTAGTGEWYRQMPLTSLHRGFNTNSTEQGQSVNSRLILPGVTVDWNTSFVTVVKPFTLTEPVSILFMAYYK